jgi:hypothetical protein
VKSSWTASAALRAARRCSSTPSRKAGRQHLARAGLLEEAEDAAGVQRFDGDVDLDHAGQQHGHRVGPGFLDAREELAAALAAHLVVADHDCEGP